MPEGPEIRLAADRIAAVLEGQRLSRVFFSPPHLSVYASVLARCRVLSVIPRGKALLIKFDNNLTLYSHNQLYGLWIICLRGEEVSTNRVLRVALHTQRHKALLYSASSIEVLTEAELAAHPFLNRIGPDLLSQELGWRQIAERLLAPRFRRRALASLYLDQAFVAGIGNYLRSEILFHAAVWPWQKPTELSRGAAGRLARSTLLINQRAYAKAGVTNPARRVSELRDMGADYEASRFAVFGRDGLPCYQCSTPIMKATAASRRLYYCAVCQAAPGVA